LNFPFYIARKVGVTSRKSFSNIIMRIAIAAIALSISVMIISTATVRGFKSSISEKIFGFWGHIHITSSYAPSSYAFEVSPMSIKQEYYPAIDSIRKINYAVGLNDPNDLDNLNIKTTHAGIRHIQSFAQKEGIIKANEQIEGIILRGVGPDFDWNFLSRYITDGSKLDSLKNDNRDQIMISETTAKRLKLKVSDDFLIYFVQGGNAQAQKFRVKGIFKTGLEEYDKRFAIVQLNKIQELNNWRPYRNYGPEHWLEDEKINLLGVTDTSFKENRAAIADHIVAGKIPESLDDPDEKGIIITKQIATLRNKNVGDTIQFSFKDFRKDLYVYKYKVAAIFEAPNDPNWQITAVVPWHSLDALNKELPAQVSGFEVFVEDMRDLDALGNYINNNILLNREQYANTIKELEPNIFDWLSLTDMNELIILVLMIIVSIINMTTSLMILILERTNMIGILKALGTRNWTIRKIFLYNAAYIVGLGMLIGNVLGIGLCLIQYHFGIVTLPEDMYYVSVAPVKLEWLPILLLNIGTLIITLIVLIIPSWLVSRIDPVKAIRFK
jgi:lipoprotein-releasing system permease protein